MAAGTIPAGATFTVNSATSLTYDGTRYEGVDSITLGDGTVTTLQELYDAGGGQPLDVTQLKACVKVEGIDPDQNNRQVFTVYSNNSRQVVKNETASVSGGLWCEMFGLDGTPESSYIVKMWDDWYHDIEGGYAAHLDPSWLGFRLNYGISEDRVYTMTWVNDFLEESQPCPPTEVGVTMMHYPKLTGKFVAPGKIVAGGIDHLYVPIRYFRLYRSNTTDAGAAIYQRVPIEPASPQFPTLPEGSWFPHNIAVTNPLDPTIYDFSFSDTLAGDKLLEPLPSVDWTEPPIRAMRGLTAWRNGMMAAYNGNTLMLCEPYRPFAWPRKYWFPLPEEIIALVCDDNSLVAITKGAPFIFSGAHPAGVSYEPLENGPAGIEAANYRGYKVPTKAVTPTPAGVVYAASDGLWNIAGGRVRALARGLFTAEEWRQRYKSNLPWLRLTYTDGMLLGYLTFAGPGFKLNVAEPDAQLVKYWPEHPNDRGTKNTHPVTDFISPLDGRLRLVFPPYGGMVDVKEAFAETEARIEATYWTRKVLLAKPENLGAWEIRGYGGDVMIEFFDDRSDATPFHIVKDVELSGGPVRGRLPAGRKAINYSVRVTLYPSAIVRELTLASTPQELERV